MTQQVRQTMKVLEALASAIAAEGVDHVFAVMGDAGRRLRKSAAIIGPK